MAKKLVVDDFRPAIIEMVVGLVVNTGVCLIVLLELGQNRS